MNVQVSFSKELQNYLMSNGYSHILSLGLADNQQPAKTTNSNYILVALKPDDPRINYQETDLIIEGIGSNEVHEMADGVSGVKFLIDIDEADYKLFKKRQSKNV